MLKDSQPHVVEEPLGYLAGPIGGPIIDHQHLLNTRLEQDPTEDAPQRRCLVEGRHDDRESGIHTPSTRRPYKFCAGPESATDAWGPGVRLRCSGVLACAHTSGRPRRAGLPYATEKIRRPPPAREARSAPATPIARRGRPRPDAAGPFAAPGEQSGHRSPSRWPPPGR